MSRQRTIKSKTDPESVGVYVAGISMKVRVHYPGRSQGLLVKAGLGKKEHFFFFLVFEKSAEGILGESTITEGPNFNFNRRITFEGSTERKAQKLRPNGS